MSRKIVEAVLAAHAHLVVQPNGEKFEDMRRSLLTPIIDALPGGRARWGILKKTGGVPSDVVTDLQSPTHEHFDAMSGENVLDENGKKTGTSRITPVWKSNGDYRRHSPHWKRETLNKALAEGWVDPLPDSQPDPGPDPGPTDPLPQPGDPGMPQPWPNPSTEARVAAIEQKLAAVKAAL